MSKNSSIQKSMIVAGVMSGTSADGINVALVRIASPVNEASTHKSSAIADNRGQTSWRHTIELLGHAEFPYPSKVRAAILAAMNAQSASVADLARLNFLLGELYAEAVLKTQKKFHIKAALVGCHGQTLYHQGKAFPFLGRKVATTWQTGEGAVIAARVGAPVVSDFRPADMAASGVGAPLVPYFDYLMFRSPEFGRVAQNIGGIANLSSIPARAKASEVTAFDTGPGNMVIDAVTHALYGRPFDRDGRIAAAGIVREDIVRQTLRRRFFQTRPPKTAGREEFGREFVREFLAACGRARKQDVVATATALTARSIADAVRRFVLRASTKNVHSFREMILSGGGAQNSTLVGMLAEALAPLGVQLRFSDEFGVPSAAKEAMAFAVLAYEAWHRRSSNVPSATGAKRLAILGKISYV
jgi:anhydro-N-acetylmuramic acid kinase